MLTARLIIDLGIWLSPIVYQCLPLLVPYSVRDPESRGDKAHGIPDQWGGPNADGVFRDDNSLVKGVPRSLRIDSKRNVYRGTAMDQGFVAAHVWRRLTSNTPSTRDRRTYSFVPNLVWLPSDVARLTDREGSFVQSFVQAVSAKIYRDTELTPALRAIVEPIWGILPQAGATIPAQALPDLEDLNFFVATPRWLKRRLDMITDVNVALVEAQSESLSRKVVSGRFTAGLHHVAADRLSELHIDLDAYARAAEESINTALKTMKT
jgi:hypothetical protein